MNTKVHILNDKTAGVLCSEQAGERFTLSEVDVSILCGKTFGKEEKKHIESFQESDFLLEIQMQTHCNNVCPHTIYLINSNLQYSSARKISLLFADFLRLCVLSDCSVSGIFKQIPLSTNYRGNIILFGEEFRKKSCVMSTKLKIVTPPKKYRRNYSI